MKEVKEVKIEAKLCPVDGVVQATPSQLALGSLLKMNISVISSASIEFQYDLAGDLFFSLYINEPKIKPNSNNILLASIMDALINSAYFAQVKELTTGDLLTSMSIAKSLHEALINVPTVKKMLPPKKGGDKSQSLDGNKKQGKNKNKGDEGDEDNNSHQSKDGHRQQSQSSSKDNKRQSQSQSGDGNAQNNERGNANAQNQKRLAGQFDRNSLASSLAMDSFFQGAVASACSQGLDRASKLRSQMSNWGCGNTSDVHEMAETISLLDNISSGEVLAQNIGRLKEAASRSIEKTVQAHIGPGTVLQRSTRLDRALPSELAYLSSENMALRGNKIHQYLSGGLQARVPITSAKKRGSVIFLVDLSGSMIHNDAHIVAKSIVVATAKAIEEDRLLNIDRKWHVIAFDDEELINVPCEEGMHGLMKFAAIHPEGGTSFDVAFDLALKAFKAIVKGGDIGVDLVFLSDGNSDITSVVPLLWKQIKERFGTRIVYIAIGGVNAYVAENMSDALIFIKDAEELHAKDEIIAERIASEIIEADFRRMTE